MYESSLETVNRVLSMMKCQVVEHEPSEINPAREDAPERLEATAAISSVPTQDNTLESLPTSWAQPMNCHLAKFIHREFKFSIENGRVVVPRERIFDVEKALTGAGIEGITPFNAHTELVASKEVRLHE